MSGPVGTGRDGTGVEACDGCSEPNRCGCQPGATHRPVTPLPAHDDLPDEELLRQLRTAIADPGQFLPRGENYTETITSWSARAVAASVLPSLRASIEAQRKEWARKLADLAELHLYDGDVDQALPGYLEALDLAETIARGESL